MCGESEAWPNGISDRLLCHGGFMAEFRLSAEDGDIVDTATHSDDQAAIAWRSSHPFLSPGSDEGRLLRLEKLVDGHWMEIDALGTAEID